MTDALPADMPQLEPARGFDSARLIAEVRRGDEDSIAEAYRVTFGTALGRVVLLHALASIGRIGAPRGPETPEAANHLNGRGSAVLEIAGLAGFDPVAISAAGLTQTLEGAAHEHAIYGRQRFDGRPDVIFDDGFDGGADGPDDGFGDGADDIDTGRVGPVDD
jgi:hypothetical protein